MRYGLFHFSTNEMSKRQVDLTSKKGRRLTLQDFRLHNSLIVRKSFCVIALAALAKHDYEPRLHECVLRCTNVANVQAKCVYLLRGNYLSSEIASTRRVESKNSLCTLWRTPRCGFRSARRPQRIKEKRKKKKKEQEILFVARFYIRAINNTPKSGRREFAPKRVTLK